MQPSISSRARSDTGLPDCRCSCRKQQDADGNGTKPYSNIYELRNHPEDWSKSPGIHLQRLEKCLGQKVTTDSKAQAIVCEYCLLGSTQL